MVTYLIHDNGGRPFQVKLPRGRKVATVISTENDTVRLSVPYQTAFIGDHDRLHFAPLCPDPNDPTTTRGNTILLVKGKTATFIGWGVYTFKITAPIVHYFSEIGNNDVPYPVAVDKAGHYYMLTHDEVSRSRVPYPTMISNAFRYFYAHTNADGSESKRAWPIRRTPKFLAEQAERWEEIPVERLLPRGDEIKRTQ